MGLFNGYLKEGKGVSKNSSVTGIYGFFGKFKDKFWSLLGLNLLFLLFCIPVITIGPSFAAMNKICRYYVQGKNVYLFEDFWQAFKENFKQGLIVGILNGLIAFVLIFTINWYNGQTATNSFMYVPFGVSIFCALLFALVNLYIFPIMVTIDLKLKHLVRNSLILGLAGMKTNFIMIILLVAYALLGIFIIPFPILIIITLIFGFSIPCFINMFNAFRYIEKYLVLPMTPSEPTENEDELIFEDDVK